MTRATSNQQRLIERQARMLGLPLSVMTAAHAPHLTAAGLPLPDLGTGWRVWLAQLDTAGAVRLMDVLRIALGRQAAYVAPNALMLATQADVAAAAIDHICEHPDAVARLRALEDVGVCLGRALEDAMVDARVARAAKAGG